MFNQFYPYLHITIWLKFGFTFSFISLFCTDIIIDMLRSFFILSLTLVILKKTQSMANNKYEVKHDEYKYKRPNEHIL